MTIAIVGCGTADIGQPQQPAAPRANALQVEAPQAEAPRPAMQGPRGADQPPRAVARPPAGGDGQAAEKLRSPLARALLKAASEAEGGTDEEREVIEKTLRENDAELERSLGDNSRRRILRANIIRSHPTVGRGYQVPRLAPPPTPVDEPPSAGKEGASGEVSPPPRD